MKQRRNPVGKKPSKVNTKLRKGDIVKIIAGKEKGRSGKILEIDRHQGRLVVEKINVQRKTVKKSKDNPKGGIIDKEAPLAISNAMYLEGEKITRLGVRFEDGKRVRYGKRSEKVL